MLAGEERRQHICIALLRDLAVQALSTQPPTPEAPWLATLPAAVSAIRGYAWAYMGLLRSAVHATLLASEHLKFGQGRD